MLLQPRGVVPSWLDQVEYVSFIAVAENIRR